jgi:hypothetical protein
MASKLQTRCPERPEIRIDGLKSLEKILAKPRGLSFFSARTATNDPFVYRLGLQIFILARRVRLPYGSPS